MTKGGLFGAILDDDIFKNENLKPRMQTVDQIYRRNKKKKVWKFLMTLSNIASIRIKKEVFEAEE